MSAEEKISVIPEVYYDIIGRLIPGGLLVGVYCFKSLQKDLNFSTATFATICSYCVGFALNLLSEFLWGAGLKFQKKFIKPLKFSEDLWTKIRRDLREADKVLMIKMFSELALFRSIVAAIICCMFVEPEVFIYATCWKYYTVTSLLTLFFVACAWHQRRVIYQTTEGLINSKADNTNI